MRSSVSGFFHPASCSQGSSTWEQVSPPFLFIDLSAFSTVFVYLQDISKMLDTK